jgi:hypothetical protein
MMMETSLHLEPLNGWPRKVTEDRKSGPYKVDWVRIIRDLRYELERLFVVEACLRLDVSKHQLSKYNATALAPGAAPATPRVALEFDLPGDGGAVVFRCDRFYDFRHNVRAIGLGMERLRLVEDTGIVTKGEQYTGFKALPAGIPMPAPRMTVEEAGQFFARFAPSPQYSGLTHDLLTHKPAFDAAYRTAVKDLHPDRGGDQVQWHRLQEAAAVLEAHFARGVRS